MRTGWVDKIGAFEVERRPMGVDFGAVDLGSSAKGVGHTTEGSSEVPNYGNSAPQLTIGQHGLYQHRQFGRMAGTLRNLSGGTETNRLVRIQFELVGFTSREPWLPATEKQREMVAAVFQFAKSELGVPADHVWPDIQDEGILATESYHRRHKKFPGVAGWYCHGEVPENSHWDWGSMLVTKLMEGADEPKFVKAFAIVEIKRDKEGHREVHEISPFFSERAALRDWAVVGDTKGDKDAEDELRKRVWDAMVDNRIRVAERRVKPEKVRA